MAGVTAMRKVGSYIRFSVTIVVLPVRLSLLTRPALVSVGRLAGYITSLLCRLRECQRLFRPPKALD